MFWQLFGTSGLLVLSSLIFLGWIVAHRVENNQLVHIEDRLRAKALIVQEMIRGQSPAEMASVLKRVTTLQTESSTRITIIGVDGRVLAETTSEDPGSLENHGSRPEIVKARESPERFGVSIRHSTTLQQKMIYVALRTEGVPGVAFVRLALPLTKIQEEITHLTGLIWTTAGLTALLSLLLAFWLVRGFLRPLRELSAGADKIALGDYGHRIGADGPPSGALRRS